MTINRANIAKQLIPGLNAIVGLNYGMVDGDHKVLFEEVTSNRSFEEDQMMAGLAGIAPTKAEGAGIIYSDMLETYTARYNFEVIAMGFTITEEAIEDNLYESKGKMRAAALGRTMANTKQIKAANVFNLGFSTAQLGGDAVPLFSASHPVVSGTQSNLMSLDLAESALETSIINISLLRDERGVLIGAVDRSLHIPPQLRFTASKILKSDLSTTTATNSTTGVTNVNDMNALKDEGVLNGGVYINRRFTDTDAWFIKTDVPNGTKFFMRAPLKYSTEGDFETGNVRYKARERYGFGWTDWRQWYGSQGA